MNNIYDKLVKEEGDIVGLLAYSIYKQHKIEYINSFKNTNSNKEPEQKDIDNFKNAMIMDSQLSLFRQKAEKILMDISETISTEAHESFKSNVSDEVFNKIDNINTKIENIDGKVNNIEKNDYKTFLYGSFQSLIGSIFFIFFVGLVYFFISSLKIDPYSIFETKNNKQEIVQSKKDFNTSQEINNQEKK